MNMSFHCLGVGSALLMHVILTHENTDFDAIAAMLGAWKLFPDALPVVPRRPNRNVRDFLTLYWDELPFIRGEDLPRRAVEQATVVDTQSFSPVKGMTPATPIQIIDHHPLTRDPEPRVTIHTESTGATTSILVERIIAGHIMVSPVEATLLLLGIYEDTGGLSYGTTTSRDMRVAAWLLDQGANLNVVNDFLHHPISEEQRRLYHLLVQNTEPYQFSGHTVIVATARVEEPVEEISTLAHKLRDLYDPDALFVLVKMNDHIQLVARSTTDSIDVSFLAEAFGGGGHGRAAAALIHEERLSEIHDRLVDLLEQHVRPATTVAEIMSMGVHTIDSTAQVKDAAAMMSRLGHEGFPVVEEGHVVGILARREIDRAMQLKLGDAPVSLYMTPGEIQVYPHSSIEELQGVMMQYGVGQVPVVRDGDPIGIVTRTDLIKLWSAPMRRPPPTQDMAAQLSRAVPPELDAVLREAGRLADEMGYSLYVVGGFVRDLLLNSPNLDLDLVVEGNAIRLARSLARRLGGRVRSHSRFRTAKWLPPNADEGHPLPALDFVTARTEFYEHPTALPQVERSSIKHDLHRRDFTINTLAIRLNHGRYGELLDFYGGEADLQQGLIRVLHSLSFVEDPTRMLRAVRLEQRLSFLIEPRTRELIDGALDLLSRTGAERVRHELDLILAEEEPERALHRLDELRLLGKIDPALKADEWFMEHARLLRTEWRQLVSEGDKGPAPAGGRPIFPVESVPRDNMYLGLLTYRMSQEELESFLQRLRMMRENVQLTRQLNDLREVLPQLAADRMRRSQIYDLLHPFEAPALFVLYIACDSWLIRQRIELFQRSLRHVKPGTDGHRLTSLGLSPGPAYREIIDRLRAAWLDGEIHDQAGEEAYLQELLRQYKA